MMQGWAAYSGENWANNIIIEWYRQKANRPMTSCFPPCARFSRDQVHCVVHHPRGRVLDQWRSYGGHGKGPSLFGPGQGVKFLQNQWVLGVGVIPDRGESKRLFGVLNIARIWPPYRPISIFKSLEKRYGDYTVYFFVRRSYSQGFVVLLPSR